MSVEVDAREPSDAELLTAVASGDDDAYGVLWARHESAARRLAGQLTRPSNVDDLVSESFLRVFNAVKNGGGPDSAFRPYLFNTMRRYNIDTGRSYHQRVALTEDDAILDVDHAEAAGETYSADAEQRAAWQAWASLPDESRTLLWHLVIEEETPARIAPLLGVSPNGVSSRAVRAKERLRQAFLAQHLAQADTDECRAARALLGAYVRDALSTRDRTAVDEHLADCRRCSAAVAELRDVNGTLRLVIAPLVLGGAVVAARYLAAGHAAAAAATTAAATTTVAATMSTGSAGHGPAVWLVGKVRNLGSGGSSTTVAAGAGGVLAVACAAAAIAYAATDRGHSPQSAAAQSPLISSVSPLPPAPAPLGQPAPAVSSPRPSSPRPTPTPTPTPTTTTPTSPAPSTSAPAVVVVPSSPKPTPTPTPTPSSTPSHRSTPPPPPPPLVTRPIPIALPAGVLLARVTVTLPKGWTIVSATGGGLDLSETPSGGSYGAWLVAAALGPMEVTVIGPRSPAASATVTVDIGTGPQARSYPLP